MEPLRILLVISTKGWGGTEAYVSLLSKGLVEQGQKVWVACLKKSVIAQTLDRTPPLYLPAFPLAAVWAIIKIVIFVFYHRIQIIHGNSGKEYWLVFVAGLLTFRKVVISRHLMTPFSSHTKKMVQLEAKKVIAPAQATYHALNQSGIPKEKLVLIYNGIDPVSFQISPRRYRALFDLPEKAFVTGIISNIHFPKGKGHFTIIESIPLLIPKIPDAYWVIGGDGPLLVKLVQYADQLNVKDRIIFTGNLKPQQVPPVLSCLDLFVLLSHDQEGGCPLSIMEAMAAGLPVIASSIGGNAELVEHDKTGYLVKSGDLTGLVEATLDLYANPDKRKTLGEEGRKKISSFFNYKRMAEETVLLYRGILLDKNEGLG